MTIAVTALPHKYVKGLDSENLSEVPPEQWGRTVVKDSELIAGVLRSEQSAQPYTVPYAVVSDDPSGYSERCPRINKTAAQAIDDAYGIVCTIIQLDFDLPEHARWQRVEDVQSWQEWFRELEDPLLSRWAFWNTSEHGWHVRYFLTRPVKLDEYQEIAQSIYERFAEVGVSMDPAVVKWSQLLSMPRVTKQGGLKTWEQWWYRDADQDILLDPSDVPSPEHKPSLSYGMSVVNVPEAAMPPEDCLPLAYEDGDVARLTDAGKALRRLAQSKAKTGGRDGQHGAFYEAVLNARPFPEGTRDNSVSLSTGDFVHGIQKELHSGSESKQLAQISSAEHVIGYLLPSLQATDMESPREEGGTWTEKAVSKIYEFWYKDEEYHRQHAEAEEAIHRAALQRASQEPEPQADVEVRDSIQKERDAPDPYISDEERKELEGDGVAKLLGRRAVLKAGKFFAYLTPQLHYEGKFSAPSFALNALLAQEDWARKLGLVWVSEEGKRKECPFSRVGKHTVEGLLEASTVYRTSLRARYVPQTPRPSVPGMLPYRDMTFVETPVAPKRNKLVEEWIWRMSGEDTMQHRRFLCYLAAFPRFQAIKVPMLLMSGPPSAAKSSWIAAFGEFAPAKILGKPGAKFRDYTDAIVLTSDDDFPITKDRNVRFHAQRFVDAIRSIASGQPLKNERKGEDSFQAARPFRVVMAENGTALITTLRECFRRYDDHETYASLMKRMFWVRIPASVGPWISEQVDREGLGAVDGDDSLLPKAIAGHIAWIAANYNPAESFSDLGEGVTGLTAKGSLELSPRNLRESPLEPTDIERRTVSVVADMIVSLVQRGFRADTMLHLSPKGILFASRSAFISGVVGSLVTQSSLDRVEAEAIARACYETDDENAVHRTSSHCASSACELVPDREGYQLRGLAKGYYRAVKLDEVLRRSTHAGVANSEALETAIGEIKKLRDWHLRTGSSIA